MTRGFRRWSSSVNRRQFFNGLLGWAYPRDRARRSPAKATPELHPARVQAYGPFCYGTADFLVSAATFGSRIAGFVIHRFHAATRSVPQLEAAATMNAKPISFSGDITAIVWLKHLSSNV
jgi:hypothetical protein